MRRIPPLSVALFALASTSGTAFTQPAPAPEVKLVWKSPCSFSTTDGKRLEPAVRQHQCDYFLAHRSRAQTCFDPRKSLPQQRDCLSQEAKVADEAKLRYEQERDALLSATKPENVPPAGEKAPVVEVQAGIKKLEALRMRLNTEKMKVALPFGAGKEYIAPFHEQFVKLEQRIKEEEKNIPLRKLEEDKRVEAAAKKAMEKQKGKDGGSGADLKKTGDKLAKKPDGASEADLKKLYEGEGKKKAGPNSKTRTDRTDASRRRSPNAMHVRGDIADGRVGIADQFNTKYRQGGAPLPAPADGLQAPLQPAKDPLIKGPVPRPGPEAPAKAKPGRPDNAYVRFVKENVEAPLGDIGVRQIMAGDFHGEQAAKSLDSHHAQAQKDIQARSKSAAAIRAEQDARAQQEFAQGNYVSGAWEKAKGLAGAGAQQVAGTAEAGLEEAKGGALWTANRVEQGRQYSRAFVTAGAEGVAQGLRGEPEQKKKLTYAIALGAALPSAGTSLLLAGGAGLAAKGVSEGTIEVGTANTAGEAAVGGTKAVLSVVPVFGRPAAAATSWAGSQAGSKLLTNPATAKYVEKGARLVVKKFLPEQEE